MVWEIIGVLFIIYQTLEVPYKICFDISDIDESNSLFYFEIVQDFYFAIDLLVNFNTGFYDSKTKKQVMDRKLIAINYLKSWFAFDLITSFPFSFILRGSISSKKTVSLINKLEPLCIDRIFEDNETV